MRVRGSERASVFTRVINCRYIDKRGTPGFLALLTERRNVNDYIIRIKDTAETSPLRDARL